MAYPLKHNRSPTCHIRVEYYPEPDVQPIEENKNRRRSLGRTELSEEKRTLKGERADHSKEKGQLRLSDLMAQRPQPLALKAHPGDGVRSPSYRSKGQQHLPPTTPKLRHKTTNEQQPQPNSMQTSSTTSIKRMLTQKAIQIYQAEIMAHISWRASNPEAKHQEIQRIIKKKESGSMDFNEREEPHQKEVVLPLQLTSVEERLGESDKTSYFKADQPRPTDSPVINRLSLQLPTGVSQDYSPTIPINMTASHPRPQRNSLPQEMLTSASRYELRMASSTNSQKSSQGNISLNSKISSVKNKRVKSFQEQTTGDIIERVEIHLQILDSLLSNVEWIEEYYQGDADWQPVKFYSYNRYYIQRERVLHSLTKANQSCFILKDVEISKSELRQIRQTREVQQLVEDLSSSNAVVRKRLQQYFDALLLKPHDHLSIQHLYGPQMIKECDLELQGLMGLLQLRVTPHQRNIYQQRIIAIMQIVFLLQELDGDFVKSFSQSIDVVDFNRYIEENGRAYEIVLALRCS